MPVPARATDCGEDAASSEIDSDAVREPVPVGSNVTSMVQESPAGSVAAGPAGQLFFWEKSDVFVPVKDMDEIVSGPEPVFCKATLCGLELNPTSCALKARLEGVRLMLIAVPMPESGMDCGEPLALSAIVTAAVLGPAADGWNFTEIVHFAPAASVAAGETGHAFVPKKSPGFAPVTEMFAIASDAFPSFVTKIVWADVTEPTFSLLKSSDRGDSATAGATATSVPESGMETDSLA